MGHIQVNKMQFAELQATIEAIRAAIDSGQSGVISKDAIENATTILADIEAFNAPELLDEGMAWYDVDFMIRGCIGVVAESAEAAQAEVENMCYSTIAEDASDLEIIGIEQDEESKYTER